MKALLYLLAITFVTALFTSPAEAQTAEGYHPFLTDTFNLRIGAFWPDKKFTVRVDGSVQQQDIDFDKAFKLEESETTGALDFRWRFGDKWSVWGQYWGTGSKAGVILEEDIEWEDVIFKEGTFAKGGADTKIARVLFGRTFSTGPQHEFGLGAGVHWLEVDAFIEGQIYIDEDSTGFHRGDVSAEFPLPNIGGWYMYSWSPKWLFQARVDWLSASIGDYSGGLWNTQVGIHWQAFKNTGIGLYHNGLFIDVDVDKNDWHGKLNSDQHGPFVALTVSW